jgi:hypothetical protein
MADETPDKPSQKAAQKRAADANTSDKSESEAAPVAPPTAVSRQSIEEPNYVATGAGLRSMTGEQHGKIVDEDGNEVDLESALDYGDGTITTVQVTKRLYETFTLPGSVRVQTRLLAPAGATITRETAEGLKAGVEQEKQRAEAASETGRFGGASEGRNVEERGEGDS